MSTLIDVNVLLEMLLPGRPHPKAAEHFIAHNRDLVLSPLSAHLYVHFGRKGGIALDSLLNDLEDYRFTNMGNDEVMWAIRNCQGTDFEDALQVACAVLHGCTSFATFDNQLAKKYGRFIDTRILG